MKYNAKNSYAEYKGYTNGTGRSPPGAVSHPTLVSYMLLRSSLISPGGKVARPFPMEVTNFGAAIAVVGTNTYYGFSNDLDLVQSTKFKNLAFIAIQLLQKHRGQEYVSLKNYRGTGKKPSKADLVMDMLDAYAPDNEESDDVDPGAAQVFRNLKYKAALFFLFDKYVVL